MLLQPLQPIAVLLNDGCQVEDELNTTLTTRVIDRLRLRTLHTRKILCGKKESLPLAPTTERLPTPHALQGFLAGSEPGQALMQAGVTIAITCSTPDRSNVHFCA